MAKTTNLRLDLLEGSSLVDYNQINAYVQAIDNLGVDYVTQKGFSGDWWFRVWKSGRGECGVDNRKKYESLNLNTEWGAVNSTGIWIPKGRLHPWEKYPIGYYDRPYVNVCFNYCTENASLIVIQSNVMLINAPEFVLGNSGPVVLHDVQLSINCTGNVR